MKVFSLEKFNEECAKQGKPHDNKTFSWPKECDGLTESEIRENGWVTNDAWMIEKGEKK